jgi:hypothetical protein
VDWHELNKKRVVDLRAMMQEQMPEVQGVIGMKKEQLIEQLAAKMGIERPAKRATGIDKTAVKKEIGERKAKRQAALEARDPAELKKQRRAIHRLKRRLRRAASLR